MNSDVPNLDLETPNPAPAQPVAKTAREEVSKSESEPVGTRESDPVRKWESEKSRAPHLRTCLLLLALVIGHWSLVISAPAATPPIITTQPQPSTNLTATEVIFTVHATGTEPLRYQWYYTPPPPSTNITPFALPGETNTTLIYTNLGAFQKGYYTVTITNAAGALTSNPVYLTIHIPPLVTRQPAHLTAPVGGTATFAITATGDAPLRYQWFFNIIEELIGATNATLTLTNLQKIHTGTYQIEASNDYDTVNSIEAQLTVKDPALITTPPASQNLPTGSPAHFTVLHTGDGPFAYQWYFNATTPLFGATNNTLTLANAQLAHTGDYTVHITTPGLGTITSTPPARLTILQAPALTQQPQGTAANLGSNVTFTAAGTGTAPLNFQWRYNGLAIPGATNSEPAILNVQRSTLALQNVQPAQAGLYTLTINNPLGASTSLQASLTVYLPPTLTTAPTNQTVRAGQTATLAATATGTSPLTYRWYFNNTPLPNAPFPTLTLQNVQLAHAGNYTLTVSNLAGLVTSPAARLTVASPPVILQQPVSRAILPGGAPTFTVQAAGDAPLAFQWYYNGTPLPGATNSEPVTTNLFDSQLSTPRLSTLTLQNAQPTDAGLYTVRITNALGSVSSAAATLAIQQPPTITSPPASLTLTQGNSATFSVTVTGDGPMHYRWLQNGTNLLDPQLSTPRLSTLTLSNVQPAAAGNYTVIVTNEVGTATSSEARLIVRTPPAILQQPRSLFVAPGGSATFTLSATGEAPLTYQWSFNGTPLPEATNVTFTVANITPAADGLYTLTISNQIGTITSTGAALQVRTPPLITTQPVSLTTTQGQNATFRVQASGDGPHLSMVLQRHQPPRLSTPDSHPQQRLTRRRRTLHRSHHQPRWPGHQRPRPPHHPAPPHPPPATRQPHPHPRPERHPHPQRHQPDPPHLSMALPRPPHPRSDE